MTYENVASQMVIIISIKPKHVFAAKATIVNHIVFGWNQTT